MTTNVKPTDTFSSNHAARLRPPCRCLVGTVPSCTSLRFARGPVVPHAPWSGNPPFRGPGDQPEGGWSAKSQHEPSSAGSDQAPIWWPHACRVAPAGFACGLHISCRNTSRCAPFQTRAQVPRRHSPTAPPARWKLAGVRVGGMEVACQLGFVSVLSEKTGDARRGTHVRRGRETGTGTGPAQARWTARASNKN